jgi:hypothetical protein
MGNKNVKIEKEENVKIRCSFFRSAAHKNKGRYGSGWRWIVIVMVASLIDCSQVRYSTRRRLWRSVVPEHIIPEGTTACLCRRLENETKRNEKKKGRETTTKQPHANRHSARIHRNGSLKSQVQYIQKEPLELSKL